MDPRKLPTMPPPPAAETKAELRERAYELLRLSSEMRKDAEVLLRASEAL